MTTPIGSSDGASLSKLDPNEADPVVLWAEIARLNSALQGPEGFATWQDAAVAERIRRVKAERSPAYLLPAEAREITDALLVEIIDHDCDDMQSVLAIARTLRAALSSVRMPATCPGPLQKLLDYCDDSDGSLYGTLSTSLVRELVLVSLSSDREMAPEAKEPAPPKGYESLEDWAKSFSEPGWNLTPGDCVRFAKAYAALASSAHIAHRSGES